MQSGCWSLQGLRTSGPTAANVVGRLSPLMTQVMFSRAEDTCWPFDGEDGDSEGVLKKGSVQMMFEFLAVRLKARLIPKLLSCSLRAIERTFSIREGKSLPWPAAARFNP